MTACYKLLQNKSVIPSLTIIFWIQPLTECMHTFIKSVCSYLNFLLSTIFFIIIIIIFKHYYLAFIFNSELNFLEKTSLFIDARSMSKGEINNLFFLFIWKHSSAKTYKSINTGLPGGYTQVFCSYLSGSKLSIYALYLSSTFTFAFAMMAKNYWYRNCYYHQGLFWLSIANYSFLRVLLYECIYFLSYFYSY